MKAGLYKRKSFDIQSIMSVYRFEPLLSEADPYPEQYDFWQILYVLKGSGIYESGHKRLAFSEGMAVFRPPNLTSRIIWNHSRPSLAIVSFRCGSEKMDYFSRAPFQIFGEESATLLDLVKTATRIYEPSDIRGARLKPDIPPILEELVTLSLERFLIILFCRMNGIEVPVDETEKVNKHIGECQVADRMKSYLSEHLHENITIETLSLHFGISKAKLSHVFKQETGQGVISYLNDLKIAAAKNMISRSAMSFYEISESLNFSSACYFSKVFKNKTGYTPTEYSRLKSKRKAGRPLPECF